MAKKKEETAVAVVSATEFETPNPVEYGLEETKAQDIANQFRPMLDKMVELEAEYNEITLLDVEDPETAVKAKDLRLKYVKVRTGTAAIHKEQKAFYLKAGRYVDGWKNTQEFAGSGIEKKLGEIENHALTIEHNRVEALREKRHALLMPLVVDETHIPEGVGRMPDEIWDNYLVGQQAAYDLRVKAEKEAEEARIEKERLELLYATRKDLLLVYWGLMDEEQRAINFALMSVKEWDAFVAGMVQVKVMADKKKAELEKENAKLKEAEKLHLEAEDKEKKRLVKANAEHLENCNRILIENGYALEDGNYIKSHVKLPLERLDNYTSETLLERIKEVDEMLKMKEDLAKAETAPSEKIIIKQESTLKDPASWVELISELESIKDKYKFNKESDKVKFGKVCGLLDKVVIYINKD